MAKIGRREWLSWGAVGLLALLCGFLALLQNRWIGEISRAEKDRLHQQLQTELNRLSRDFNGELTSAVSDLLPPSAQIETLGAEKAYSDRYSRWRDTHERLFNRIALAVPREEGLVLLDLNLDNGQFSQGDWPPAWTGMRQRIEAHLGGERAEPVSSTNSTVIEIPRFGRPGGPGKPDEERGGPPRMVELEWLIVEINLNYIRGSMLPDLLRRHLGGGGKLPYQAEVVNGADPSNVIFHSGPEPDPETLRSPDASVNLFEVSRGIFMRRSFDRGPGERGPRERGRRERAPARFPRPPSDDDGGHGQWRLAVRHEAGSIEAVVSRARWQNLATSLGIILLILATVAALVRASRRAQQLAELQMNFVASVSHELRTPITVIRTAAFNLRGRISSKPEQVERYGRLISEESEKLTALVEQVLRFASAGAGHVIRAREPVAVEDLIEDGLRSSQAALAGSGLVVEKKIDADLPLVLADELAMKHALKNLLDNALKYGTEGSNWIGVFASSVSDERGAAVEVRVADHGPGIPLDEQEHIFDPFFRGSRALRDQVHGTGLGLNLVKKIVEAHGGAIHVESEPMKGTTFVLRIPAASPELQDEFAHSFS